MKTLNEYINEALTSLSANFLNNRNEILDNILDELPAIKGTHFELLDNWIDYHRRENKEYRGTCVYLKFCDVAKKMDPAVFKVVWNLIFKDQQDLSDSVQTNHLINKDLSNTPEYKFVKSLYDSLVKIFKTSDFSNVFGFENEHKAIPFKQLKKSFPTFEQNEIYTSLCDLKGYVAGTAHSDGFVCIDIFIEQYEQQN